MEAQNGLRCARENLGEPRNVAPLFLASILIPSISAILPTLIEPRYGVFDGGDHSNSEARDTIARSCRYSVPKTASPGPAPSHEYEVPSSPRILLRLQCIHTRPKLQRKKYPVLLASAWSFPWPACCFSDESGRWWKCSTMTSNCLPPSFFLFHFLAHSGAKLQNEPNKPSPGPLGVLSANKRTPEPFEHVHVRMVPLPGLNQQPGPCHGGSGWPRPVGKQTSRMARLPDSPPRTEEVILYLVPGHPQRLQRPFSEG